MTKVVLIRHGQTEWNIAGKYQGQSDVALSDKGIEQARCLAQNFPLEQLDAVYASDLSRALVTAEQVARHFGCVVQPEPSLREMNFGEWEGLTYKQIAAQWPEAMGTFFQRPDMLEIPGGEGFAVVDRDHVGAYGVVALHPQQVVHAVELAQRDVDHVAAVIGQGLREMADGVEVAYKTDGVATVALGFVSVRELNDE